MLRRVWLSLPKLIRFMLVHVANGMVIGCGLLLLAIPAGFPRARPLLAGTRAGSRPSCCSSRQR